MGPGRGAGEIGRPGCGARGPLCPWAAVRVGGRAWPDNEPKRRSKLAAGTAEAGGADTTAIQISHVIHCGHFLRRPKNVAIPTMQIQCLNESSRNYVRNCWLAAIAGRRALAGQRAEASIEACGADSLPAGRPRRSPAPRPGPAPRKPAGPQATTSATRQHVVSNNPAFAQLIC